MGNFIASKLFVGIASFAGGVVTTYASQRLYATVKGPKPIVFNAKAMEKMSPEERAALKDLAEKAGLSN